MMEDEDWEEYDAEEFKRELETMREIEENQSVKAKRRLFSSQDADSSGEQKSTTVEQVHDEEIIPSLTKKRRIDTIDKTSYHDRLEPTSHPKGVFDEKPIAAVLSMSITSSSGDTMYITYDDDDDDNENAGSNDWSSSGLYNSTNHLHGSLNCPTKKQISLLPVPVKQLFERIDAKEFENRIRKEFNQDAPTSPSSGKLDSHLQIETSQLFASKYAPKKFVDLLTNEKFNREILKWVIDFGKKKTEEQKPKNKSNNNRFNRFFEDHKILLLAGPPGVGKTTLAHVIAKHAKYRPIEVNASDERSPSDLLDKVPMLITADINGFDADSSKPKYSNGKLLILDEIDGISGSEAKNYIETLLKIAYPKDDTAKKQKSGKKSKKEPSKLQNPIICICNDQYAPSLRELKKKSKIFIFKKEQINIPSIVERLKFICRNENLEVTTKSLTELAQRHEGDMRACLNTLQLLKSQITTGGKGNSNADKILSGDVVSFSVEATTTKNYEISSIISSKDIRKDYFSICHKIFHNPNNSSIPLSNSYITSLISDVSSEKLLDGCFENYPHVRYSDYDMKKTVECLDATSYNDIMNRTIHQTQQYTLNQYSSYPLLTYHRNCSSMYKPTIVYPKSEFEVSLQRKQNNNIVASFLSDIDPSIRRNYTPSDAKLDLIPLIFDAIRPQLRQQSVSSSQHLTSSEKRDIAKSVSIHISYGLSYQQVYEDGKSEFAIQPEINRLVRCGNHNTYKQLSHNCKKILSNEITLEKIRRSFTNEKFDKTKTTDPGTDKIQMKKEENQHPFKVPHSPRKSNSKPVVPCIASNSVHFKFNEGSSSAVRRAAKMNEFL